MGVLRDRMETDMKLRNFRPATRSQYLLCARKLAQHYRRSPAELDEEHVRGFLQHLSEGRGLSSSTLGVYSAALKFLFEVTLRRPEMVSSLVFPKRQSRLPEVLSGSEVERLLVSIRSTKQRAVASVMYAAGLRVSEACNLKVNDIDSQRMLIHIRDSKGGGNRFAMLSTRLHQVLREYWRSERPEPPHLFPGQRPGKTLSCSSVQKALARAARECGIAKHVTPHVLRHSFAAHMLELGTDTRVIQVVLGHRSIRSTQLYARVSSELIGRAQSPLDLLGTRQGTVLG